MVLGVVWRRLGVENIQADPGQPSRPQRGQGGVQVQQAAAAAVDQDRLGPDAGQEALVDQVAGLGGQGHVQGQDVAGGSERLQVGAVEAGW